MSSLDPFGSARPPSAYKPRSKAGEVGGIFRSVDETVRDVGSHLKSRSWKGWNGISGALGLLDAGLGLIFLLWSLRLGWASMVFVTALAIGCGMALMGGVGLLATRFDSPSVKSLHLVLAVITGLLCVSFINQAQYTIKNDCVLAETYLRIEHVEEALQGLRHDEIIQGIMMRLDHLTTDIEHMQEHADDKVEESRKQLEFKHLDMKYVDEKLHELVRIAESAIASIDNQVEELEHNITRLEYEKQAADQAGQANQAQLKARLRSMKYRQRTLGPRKTALLDIITQLEQHADSGASTEQYMDILRALERSINDKELQGNLKKEAEEANYVKASMTRLQENNYHNLIVGDYEDRTHNRTASRERQRSRYEKMMSNVFQKHDNKLTSKETYLRSLNDWLEAMPEHCVDDLDDIESSTALGWAGVVLAVGSAYVTLTTTVASSKKDF